MVLRMEQTICRAKHPLGPSSTQPVFVIIGTVSTDVNVNGGAA